ncbi:MAG TPA: SDR family oxidoreductase [Symbiobacteriaceae bacterium]|jgi:NAD(P)-dependent dehydrogenase (short-subunit alcohol dehydrogenase family)|nr:SDR family oxidoreductase [Symbiobacteriaceae bacterium]
MKRLEGKVAVITGASRGIGPAIVAALAEEGAQVVLASRNAEELLRAAERIANTGATALAIPTDVSVEEQVVGLFAQTMDQFGRIDILVNNAGVGVFGPLVESTTEQWDWVVDITLKGAYLVARECLKQMLRQGEGGLIINVGSDLSYRTSENCGVYGTAKYGVGALTEVINKEYRTKGIRCTGLYPGMIDTYFAGSEKGADYKKDWLKDTDLAEAVRYIATQPSYVRIDEIRLHPMIQEQF